MSIFDFGETVKGYEVKVINERVARAGAGILFAIGLVTFMKSFLTHDFAFAKVFITLFAFDFFMRVFINPKFSPSLILGYFFVRKQTPEYVGASQKRFAWGIGFVLAVTMFVIVVLLEMMTPAKIAICMICLLFLFFESAFGICVGCKIYHLFKKETMYCAGGCGVSDSDRVSLLQWVIVIATIAALAFGFKYFDTSRDDVGGWQSKITKPEISEPCEHMNSDIQNKNPMNDEHMNHGM